MKSELKDGAKVSTKVTKAKGVDEPKGTKDAFKQNLQDEKDEKAEGLAKYKLPSPDGFTKLLMELFKLEGVPFYKENFTDTRWPRNEVGELIKVERVYFLALRGPRAEQLGFRPLGQDEINGDAYIIIDKLPAEYPDKLIKAKKWTAEQSHYRYFWIQEGEKFEDEEALEVFLKRFEPLATAPEYTFGNLGPFKSVVSDNPNARFM